jgi:hypothetical protein
MTQFKSKWMDKKSENVKSTDCQNCQKTYTPTSDSFGSESDRSSGEKSDDEKAREAGFLSLHPSEVYERQLTKDMHVFVMLESGKWNAWRESFKDGKSISVKQLASKVNTFDMALMKALEYVTYRGRSIRR